MRESTGKKRRQASIISPTDQTHLPELADIAALRRSEPARLAHAPPALPLICSPNHPQDPTDRGVLHARLLTLRLLANDQG